VRSVAERLFDGLVSEKKYDDAFELISRLELYDKLETLIVAAYPEFLATGRTETLGQYRKSALIHGSVAVHITDLIAAEVALTEGDYVRAGALALPAASGLKVEHALFGRGLLVAARAAVLSHRMHDALEHLRDAQAHLVNSGDVREATWLKYLAAYALEDEQ